MLTTSYIAFIYFMTLCLLTVIMMAVIHGDARRKTLMKEAGNSFAYHTTNVMQPEEQVKLILKCLEGRDDLSRRERVILDIINNDNIFVDDVTTVISPTRRAQ